ncbi:MAG: hypothetical protein KDA27_21220 [Candidatus Eisenbacteria bacterium]|uniref:Uncharacterized protein n=1 Tax=Eiseniibacteriota bacterium TaxID=2212470 RepID=A0A956SF66_UNCEI|nr:hypothetical protein [Candidatus Eisenbacteria bacterium]
MSRRVLSNPVVSIHPVLLILSVSLLLSVLAIDSPVDAGPNANGVLLVHAQLDGAYTDGDPADCGGDTPAACDEVVSRVDGEGPFLFSVLAAFPSGSSPRVAGVVFGVEYGPSIHLLDYRSCGDYELFTDDWPASGEGIAITWAYPETTLVFQMCAFLGYQYGEPALFSSIAHPTQGVFFVDDSIINDPEAPVALGSLGFGTDGSIYCPDEVGACCFSDGDCRNTSRSECEAEGGVYQGDGVYCGWGLCEPTPMVRMSWGRIRSVFRESGR